MSPEAERLLYALRAAGCDPRIRDVDAGIEVVFEVRWPFDLKDAARAGTTFTVGTRLDPRQVAADDPARLAEQVKSMAERRMTVAVLGPLAARAAELGAHRAPLAPYAREVIDRLTEYLHPDSSERAWIKQNAMPYTSADGNSRS